MGDAEAMLELPWLVLMTVLAWARPRHELVAENLFLRHQLAVLTRPTRDLSRRWWPLSAHSVFGPLGVLLETLQRRAGRKVRMFQRSQSALQQKSTDDGRDDANHERGLPPAETGCRKADHQRGQDAQEPRVD